MKQIHGISWNTNSDLIDIRQKLQLIIDFFNKLTQIRCDLCKKVELYFFQIETQGLKTQTNKLIFEQITLLVNEFSQNLYCIGLKIFSIKKDLDLVVEKKSQKCFLKIVR